MSFRWVIWILFFFSPQAAIVAPSNAQDLSPERLQKILKRFPQADFDRDGTLTKDEALEARRQSNRNGKQEKPDIAPKPTHENVKYGKFDRNVLDLWIPDSGHATALIVHIHGGGFQGGDKSSIRKEKVVQNALNQGVAFASINYRFRHLPGGNVLDPQRTGIQNILRDAARSIQFIRCNANKYNLDPTRIACFGGSAGAGTSIWLAFHDDLADPNNDDPVLRQSSRIAAAGMLAGQYTYDLEQWDADFTDRGGNIVGLHGGDKKHVALFYGMDWEEYENSNVRKDVDMRGLITADDPPVFALTDRLDDRVDNIASYNHHPRHALLIEERCKQHGVECVCLVPKVRKSDAAKLERNPELMLDFFFKHLGVEKK